LGRKGPGKGPLSLAPSSATVSPENRGNSRGRILSVGGGEECALVSPSQGQVRLQDRPQLQASRFVASQDPGLEIGRQERHPAQLTCMLGRWRLDRHELRGRGKRRGIRASQFRVRGSQGRDQPRVVSTDVAGVLAPVDPSSPSPQQEAERHTDTKACLLAILPRDDFSWPNSGLATNNCTERVMYGCSSAGRQPADLLVNAPAPPRASTATPLLAHRRLGYATPSDCRAAVLSRASVQNRMSGLSEARKSEASKASPGARTPQAVASPSSRSTASTTRGAVTA
jgi:hypothetical protein